MAQTEMLTIKRGYDFSKWLLQHTGKSTLQNYIHCPGALSARAVCMLASYDTHKYLNAVARMNSLAGHVA